MSSAAAWIAKGKAARHPVKYSVDDAELERVSQLANVQFEDAKVQLERAQRMAAEWNGDGEKDAEWSDEDGSNDEEQEEESKADDDMEDVTEGKKEDPNDLSRYNLDDYDNEEREDPAAAHVGPFSNVRGLQYYRNNDEDPYITLKNDELDEEEEKQELEIEPLDNMIVAAKTEDDVSLLEAYVYSANEANLYVHHDLMLPSFPLCLEWLDYTPAPAGADQNSTKTGARGNFIAVGTMDPEIEIWSMDVVEGLFPDALLGNRTETQSLNAPKGTGKKKRKQPKERKVNAEYHVDAVLGLSWNRAARNLLASGSADKTIKLWDLSRPGPSGAMTALRSFDTVHSDKVQSVAWDTSNSSRGAVAQPSRMLSGAYDKRLCVFDTRSPDSVVRASIAADVEAVRWNPWREHSFFAATEDGLVQSFDARMLNSDGTGTSAVFTLAAHDGGCTSIDVSPHIPGCLLTGGTDKLVKLWNVEGAETATDALSWRPSSISLVTSRNLDAGKIFSTQFSPDDPLTIVAAGSQGVVRIWDALANVGTRKAFGDRLRAMPAHLAGAAVRIDGSEPARGDGVIKMDDEGLPSDDDDTDNRDGAVASNDIEMA
jgi:periodic tryptophan protein 1